LTPELDGPKAAPLHLELGEVLRLCSIVQDQPHIVVGGQALNFWAEHYAERVPALAAYRPFASTDIDFFGRVDLARVLAERLGAELRVPEPVDPTPSAALVTTELAGRTIIIDVLADVLGVGRTELVRGQVELELPFETEAGPHSVRLVLMHPLHCLISRAVAVHHPAIARRDPAALRQLRAAPWVLAAFLDELLDFDVRETQRWIGQLGHVLARDEWVGRIDTECELDLDPLDVLRTMLDDKRLDTRFRQHQVASWVRKVERARRLRRTRHTAG
jgi:hypothetical protein